MERPVRALTLATVVVVAGCTFGGVATQSPTPTSPGPVSSAGPSPQSSYGSSPPPIETVPQSPVSTRDTGSASTPTQPGDTDGTRADPREDVLGWENGYWHDDPVDVDASDGLNGSEFRRVKARAMARVEVVRGLEFRRNVSFEFRPREEVDVSVDRDDWRDQYWDALFVVGDDEAVAAVYNRLYDVVVDGLTYGGERIVMVANDTDSPAVNSTVLAHELVHAVEAQSHVYGALRDPANLDARQARRAAVEGAATHFERRYSERCGEQWDCIDAPAATVVPPGADEVNEALYLDFAMRYSAGEQYVSALADRGGRDAVADMQSSPPVSTAQVLHPEQYPDDRPEAVPVEDRTAGDWERRARSGDGHSWSTVGEARLYTVLWYNDVVDRNYSVTVTLDQRVDTDFTHPATAGWAGDRLVLYENGTHEGFVYRSVWDSDDDARQFRAAYLQLLRNNGAEQVADGQFVVESGGFAGGYRVTLADDTVTVVNAPSADALDDVHEANATASSP